MINTESGEEGNLKDDPNESPRARSSRGLLAELLVVALGVFIALLADGWREWANERGEERRALEALSTEFAETRASFDRRLALYSAREQAILVLLDVIRGGDVPDSDSLDVLFGWSIRLGSFDPPTGALNSIIASGGLQLITDLSLRSALAQWPRALEDYNQVESVYENLVLNHYRPYLRENAGLPKRIGEASVFPPNSVPVRFSDLLSESVVEQMLRELAVYSGNLHRSGGPMLRLQELLNEIADRVAGTT